ncbi:MAG: hypothetical protein AAFV43_06675 [Planctomycetota bacterium]
MPAIDPRNIEVVDAAQAAVLRAMPASQRVAIIGQLHTAARAIIAAGIRHANPDWSDETVGVEVARRLLRGSTATAPDRR